MRRHRGFPASFTRDRSPRRRLNRAAWVETLESRTLLAGLTQVFLDGGNLVVRETASGIDNNLSVDLDVNAGLIFLEDPNSSFMNSVPGGAVVGGVLQVPISEITGDQISVTSNDGQDQVLLESSSGGDFTKSIDIDTKSGDGTVDLGELNFAADTDLKVTSDLINADSKIVLQGTGSLTLNANREVRLDAGTEIQTSAGDVTITGNVSGTASGNFTGVTLTGALIQTDKGDVVLEGNGSGTGVGNHGILLNGGSTVRSIGMGAGAGRITLRGEGSQDSTSFPNGVFIAAGTVSSIDGNIEFSGRSGGTVDAGSGVLLDSSGLVESTGTGVDAAEILIIGTGNTNGNSNRGVKFQGGKVQTADGKIEIRGDGGTNTSSGNEGITLFSGSKIESLGSGPIVLDGQGADTGTGANLGVRVQGTMITSVDGNIDINGQGGGNGTSNFNLGVWVTNGATITTTGTGNVAITGQGGDAINNTQGIQVSNSIIQTSLGDVVLNGTGAGTGADGHGVFLTGGSTVESSGTGAAAGEITVVGVGSQDASGFPNGIYVADGTVTSRDGDIVLQGTSGGSIDAGSGVLLDSTGLVESTGTGSDAAEVLIIGTGNANGSGNRGVKFQGGSVTTIDGKIEIRGDGGTNEGSGNEGITLFSGSQILSTGIGPIVLDGTGSPLGTNANLGVRVQGTVISSEDGNININGEGGGNGTSNFNLGVWVTNNALIRSTGNADVTITGEGGNAIDNTQGIQIADSTVEVTDGDVMLSGTGGGNGTGTFNQGVLLIFDAAVTSSGQGNIGIIGQGGSGTQNDDGVRIMIGSAVATTSVGSSAGNISIEGTAGPQAVGVESAGVFVNGTSSVTAVESAIALTGSSVSGGVAIRATNVDAGLGTLQLSATGGVIRDHPGAVDFAAASIDVDGDLAAGGLDAIGTMDFAGAVNFTAPFTINLEVNGPVAGADHDQITLDGVAQTFDIAGSFLELSAASPSISGAEYVIVDVLDVTSSVGGQFTGLPEGALISVDDAYFRITYQGGDGNDIALIGIDAFSYVDADNDGQFVAGIDTPLVAGELDDGEFSTKQAEGGYTSVIAGAGLVINAPIDADKVDLVAEGNLTLNADVVASVNKVELESKDESVFVVGSSLTSVDDIKIKSEIDVDINSGSVLDADSNVKLDAKQGDARVADSVVNAGRKIKVKAERDVRIELGSSLNADDDLTLTADRDVVLSGASLTASEDVKLDADRDIRLAAGDLIVAGDDVTLKSDRDVNIDDASIQAGDDIKIDAADAIFANLAMLLACGSDSKIDIKSDDRIELDGAVVRAMEKIKIKSKDAEVDLNNASVGIIGGTNGDIKIEAETDILVAGAEIIAPDNIDLDGNVIGDGTETIGNGTLPCP